jgi:hypothetical protein
VIYFIQAGRKGCIKIGYTDRGLQQRLNDLQTGNPQRLYLLLVLEGSERDEQQLHQRFAGLRRRGEWFWPGRKLLAYVESFSATTIPVGQTTLPKPRCRVPQGSRRITVWIQRRKDTPYLALRWHDPDTGRQHSRSSGAMSYAEAERRRGDLECQLNQAHGESPFFKIRAIGHASPGTAGKVNETATSQGQEGLEDEDDAP